MKRHNIKPAMKVSVAAPASLLRDRYEAGYTHALKGGKLDKIEYFRLSFREGFRAAKLHLRSIRRQQGIIEFPMKGKLKIKAV